MAEDEEEDTEFYFDYDPDAELGYSCSADIASFTAEAFTICANAVSINLMVEHVYACLLTADYIIKNMYCYGKKSDAYIAREKAKGVLEK